MKESRMKKKKKKENPKCRCVCLSVCRIAPVPVVVKFQYVCDGYVKFDDDDDIEKKKCHGNLNACILSNSTNSHQLQKLSMKQTTK